MHTPFITIVFFFYGLAFFSMGSIIALEYGRASDPRLRHALRPLAVFGIIHGGHEWLEMFLGLGMLPGQLTAPTAWEVIRLTVLAFSFLSLGAFGASLLAPDDRMRRISLVVPLVEVAIWGFGLLIMRDNFSIEGELWAVADVWTRYVLAIPSALLASAGLVAQQRAFRQAGMAQFSRDSLWAAVAFAWYGIVGQMFTRVSPLRLSTVINQEIFQQLFGFPVQLLRAASAVVAATFVIRFLRSFEVEVQRQIAALQVARLEEAQRRETLRGELLKRVVAAQEAERQRIARELHDETGQALTAIGLGLRGIATNLRQDVERAGHNLRQLEGLVAHSLDELQRLIADLRPSHLDELGLRATLRWYAGELERRTALTVEVDVEGEPQEIPLEVKTAIFRIAQEALTNVIKHSGSRSAKVHLRFDPETVSITVEDSGSGFNLTQIALEKREAWGLLGMRERAELLGGTFNLNARLGVGTRVQVILPYHMREGEADGNSFIIGG
jgi:signal transduction histidine kinase